MSLPRTRRFLLLAVLATIAPNAVSAQEKTDLPAELAVVPQDSIAFVHVRPAELGSSGLFNGFRKLFPQETDAFVKSLGEDPAETESLSVLFPSPNALGEAFPGLWDGSSHPSELLVMIETTVKPFDRTNVLQRVLGNGAIEKKHQGKTYFASRPKTSYITQGAVYFVNDRTYIYAMTEGIMQKTLEGLGRQRNASPLDAALALAGQKRQLVLGLNLTHPVLAKVRKQTMDDLRRPDIFRPHPLRAPLAALAPLLEVRSAALAVSLDKDIRLEGEATFPSERHAADASDQLKDALVLFRLFFVGQMRGELRRQMREMIDADEGSLVFGKDVLIPSKRSVTFPDRDIKPIAMAEQLLQHGESCLRKVKVEQRQATLRVLAQVPSLPDTLEARAREEVAAEIKAAQDPNRLRKKSADRLRQMMLAIHSYHDVYRQFPAPAICDAVGKPLLSWRVAILPYVEEQALYLQFRLDEPWDSAHNIKLLPKMPGIYTPLGVTTKEPHTTFYQVFTGPEAVFGLNAKRRFTDITDGISSTIGIVEAGDPVPWTKPVDVVYDAKKPLPRLGGMFADGFHVGFMDASVHFLSPTTPERTMRAWITFAGNEIVDIPK
jgi:hypothetical protein